MPSLSSRYRDPVAALLLLGAGAVFLPSLGAYFLSDDFVLLSWTRGASPADVLGFFDPTTEWFYRPLVKVYYWAGQSLFGLRAIPLHVLSILLHVANAYLLYRLLVRHGTVPWGGALFAALIFLLNTRHAETVSWVAAVGDLGGTLCILGSLLLFGRFLEHGRQTSLLGSLALFALGLLIRETVVMLPALLVLYTVVLHVRPGRANRRAFWSATYFAMLLAYIALLWLGRGSQPTLSRGGLQFRALNLDSVLLGVMDYVHGLVPGGTTLAALPLDTLRWLVWVEAALLLGLGFLFYRARRRVALFGLGWLLVAPLVFVPFSGPTDRYFYLPSIGFALIAGDLFSALLRLVGRTEARRVLKVAAALGAAAIVVVAGLGVYSRAAAWGEAGRVSGGILNDTRRIVPSPPGSTRFLFAGVPTHLGGVPLFQNGLQEAVQLTYNSPGLTASIVTCDTLPSQDPQPGSPILRFKGDGVESVTPAELCP